VFAVNYQQAFEFLTPEETQTLSGSEDNERRFIDCLAMLHEILMPFSSISPHPIFARIDNPDEIFRDAHSQLTEEFDGIKQKLSLNLSTAVALRHKKRTSLRASEIDDVTILIDNFVGDILTQYGNLIQST
jgi:hypothetical protein